MGTEAAFKEAVEPADTKRRNLLVAFYTPGCSDCQAVKETFKQWVGKKGDNKSPMVQIVEVAAVNCASARLKQQCLKTVVTSELPSIVYFGPGKMKTRHSGAISLKSLSSTVVKHMGDYCTVVSSEK